uniref:Chondroitin proteoglycan 4 domain-containing protein n=1 Tax=Trichuris muris TaxID=70415 RepID=A0A5S6R0Z2_TRIMR
MLKLIGHSRPKHFVGRQEYIVMIVLPERLCTFTLLIGALSLVTYAHPIDYHRNDSCLRGCATQYAKQWGQAMLMYNDSRQNRDSALFGFQALLDTICEPVRNNVKCTQQCWQAMEKPGKYDGSAVYSQAILNACESPNSGTDFKCVDNSTTLVRNECRELEKVVIASLEKKYLWTTDEKFGSSGNLNDFCANSKAHIECVRNILARKCGSKAASVVERLMTDSTASIANIGKDTTSAACRNFETVTLVVTSATKTSSIYGTTTENSTSEVNMESSSIPDNEDAPTAAAPNAAPVIWITFISYLAVVSVRSFST